MIFFTFFYEDDDSFKPDISFIRNLSDGIKKEGLYNIYQKGKKIPTF